MDSISQNVLALNPNILPVTQILLNTYMAAKFRALVIYFYFIYCSAAYKYCERP